MAEKAIKEKKSRIKRIKEIKEAGKDAIILPLNSKKQGLEEEVDSESFPEEQNENLENSNRKRERITPVLPQTRIIEQEPDNLEETAQIQNQARQASQAKERNLSYEQASQTRRSYASDNKYESVQDNSPEASVQRTRQARLPVLRSAVSSIETFGQRELNPAPSLDPGTNAVERSPEEEYASDRKYEKAFQERQAKRRSELF